MESEYEVSYIVQAPSRLNDKQQRLIELIESNTLDRLLEAKKLIVELINDKS